MDRTIDIGEASAGGVLHIDLAAVRRNYAKLSQAAFPASCAGVVKADAYGLGAEVLARVLYQSGCRDFFVAHLGEALPLRATLNRDATLFVLNGLQAGADSKCAAANIVPVLNSLVQAENWADEAERLGKRLPAALQLDSGMSRLGMPRDELEGFVARHGSARWIDVNLVLSHLACADEPDHPANEAQRRCFAVVAERFPEARLSLANSGGVLLGPGFLHDLTRPGIALYGVHPTPGREIGLAPVVALHAKVIQVRTIPAGTAVGYGATFVAASPMRIATLSVGYADGWPRNLGGKGFAFHAGVPLPILGRVSMDSMTIDVTSLPEGTLGLGSLVELIGPSQTLDEVAEQAGTIPYEILTRLGRRYARIYADVLDSEQASRPDEPSEMA